MTSKVTITQDRVEEVLAAVIEADKYNVLVGFPEDTAERNEGGMTNPQLAYIHNYGSPAANIPARPFLETGIEDVQDTIVAIAETVINLALDKGPDQIMIGLDRLGKFGQDAVMAKITRGPFVPLKPQTISRKGSSTPLIDTGQLRQAVSYVIREKED